MHQRAEGLLRRSLVEVLRIQRDLVGGAVVLPMLETVVGEIAEGVAAALESDQARRQDTLEQSRVEVAHRRLESGIGALGRIWGVHHKSSAT
jgi:hypothetical protein